jgi:hypothetical protein
MAYVYFLRNGDEDVFKIGRTRRHPVQRIRELSTGNPDPLALLDFIETDDEDAYERFFHRKLRSKRVEGEFYALKAAELEGAIRSAREFLGELLPKQKEADRLAREESDGRILKPGDEEWGTYRALLRVLEEEHDVGLRRASLEASLKLTIGTAAGLERIAMWTTEAAMKFDEAAFKRAQPILFQAFVREHRIRKFRLL